MPEARKRKKFGGDLGAHIAVDMEYDQQIVGHHGVEIVEDEAIEGEAGQRWLAREDFVAVMTDFHSDITPTEAAAEALWEQWFGDIRAIDSQRPMYTPHYKHVGLEISRDTLDLMVKHRRQFEQGIDFGHLPAGFKVENIDRDTRRLDYCPRRAARQKNTDPLAVVLTPEQDVPIPLLKGKQKARGVLGGMFSRETGPSQADLLNEDIRLLVEPASESSIPAMLALTPAQKVWWLTLLKQHKQTVPYDSAAALFETFQAFLRTLEDLRVKLPEQCEITDCKSLPVTLGRIVSIIKNAKTSERQAQMDWVQKLDLSSTGAVMAIRTAADNGERFQFISPEMGFTRQHFHTERQGYLSDKAMSGADLGKGEIEPVLRAFWRSVARSSDQVNTAFYKEAVRRIMDARLNAPIKSISLFATFASTTEQEAALSEAYGNDVLLKSIDDCIGRLTVWNPASAWAVASKLLSNEITREANALKKFDVFKGEKQEIRYPCLPLLAFVAGLLHSKVTFATIGKLAAIKATAADDDAAERELNKLSDGAMGMLETYQKNSVSVIQGMHFFDFSRLKDGTFERLTDIFYDLGKKITREQMNARDNIDMTLGKPSKVKDNVAVDLSEPLDKDDFVYPRELLLDSPLKERYEELARESKRYVRWLIDTHTLEARETARIAAMREDKFTGLAQHEKESQEKVAKEYTELHKFRTELIESYAVFKADAETFATKRKEAIEAEEARLKNIQCIIYSAVSAFDLDLKSAEAAYEVLSRYSLNETSILRVVLLKIRNNAGLSREKFLSFLSELEPMRGRDFLSAAYQRLKENLTRETSLDLLTQLIFEESLSADYIEALRSQTNATTEDSVEQDLIMTIVKNCTYARDSLDVYAGLLQKLAKIKSTLSLSTAEYRRFLKNLSSFQSHGPLHLHLLLDRILETRQLAIFNYMAFTLGNDVSDEQSSVDKITIFYQLKDLLDKNNVSLPQQILWPILASRFTQHTFTLHEASHLLNRLLASTEPFSKTHTYIKPLIVEFFSEAIKNNDAEGALKAPGEIQDILDKLCNFTHRYKNEPEVVEALLFHYKDAPETLINIVNLLGFRGAKGEVLLHCVVKLVNSKHEKPNFKDVNDVLYNIDVTQDRLKTMYDHAPYPPLTLIGNKELDEFNTEYEQFVKNPYPRAESNEFNPSNAEAVLQQINASRPTSKNIEVEIETFQGCMNHAKRIDTDKLMLQLQMIRENETKQPLPILAYVLEMLYRTTGQELNTTQVTAVIAALSAGQHVGEQIASGEGKSRIMMVTAACHQIMGRTVDFVTSNMQLAMRDYLEYDAFFKALEIETQLIYSNSEPARYKRGAIHFTTAAQLSLFRNKLYATESKEHRVLTVPDSERVCLLDEGDATLYDSTEHYNFSETLASDDDIVWIYPLLIKYIKSDRLEQMSLIEDGSISYANDFKTFVRSFDTALYEQLQAKFSDARLEHWIDAACIADNLKRDQHYVIENKAVIFTPQGMVLADRALVRHKNRIAHNSSYSHGVHQCLHALLNYEREQKEGLEQDLNNLPFHIEPERSILYSSNAEQLLRHYDQGHVYTVTGTLGSAIERDEAREKYGFDFMDVPRHNALKRKDKPVYLLKDETHQFEAILRHILANPQRPILIICEDDAASKALHTFLKGRMPDQKNLQRIHSANTPAEEATLIERAAADGMVTVSTDMVGRGTDIPVPRNHAQGLSVLVTYLPTERDLYQGINRAGRFGSHGESRMILAKDKLTEKVNEPRLKSNNINFYFEPERYLQFKQTEIEKRRQTQRLIGQHAIRIKNHVRDKFFAYYEALPPAQKDAAIKQWSEFLYDMDILWSHKQDTLMDQLDLLNPEKDLIEESFNAFKAEVNQKWQQTFDNQPADEFNVDLPTLDRPITPPASNPVVHEHWDMALAGRAKTFCTLFEESRAIWRGDRELFANTRAWWNGHGVLFADTRATLAGARKFFANTRATREAEKVKPS